MEDHEDYLPGEAPAAHKTTHQDGGTDEISIADLAGVSTELAAHALLPTVHQDAPALILTHKGDAAAHHAKYTDGEAQAVADTQIATHTAIATAHQDAPALILTHKGDASAHHQRYTAAEVTVIADALINTHAALPTVHQDAPALILTHKGDASAHHVKYTDAESRALLSPLSVPPGAFSSYLDTQDFTNTLSVLQNRVSLLAQYFITPVFFPNAVTITKLTLYGYRDDAASLLCINLYRIHHLGGSVIMATVTSNWTTGWSSLYDDSITNPVIDNDLYSYGLDVALNPNDSVDDVKLSGVKIEFTG